MVVFDPLCKPSCFEDIDFKFHLRRENIYQTTNFGIQKRTTMGFHGPMYSFSPLNRLEKQAKAYFTAQTTYVKTYVKYSSVKQFAIFTYAQSAEAHLATR